MSWKKKRRGKKKATVKKTHSDLDKDKNTTWLKLVRNKRHWNGAREVTTLMKKVKDNVTWEMIHFGYKEIFRADIV